jgi:hypothetical protein
MATRFRAFAISGLKRAPGNYRPDRRRSETHTTRMDPKGSYLLAMLASLLHRPLSLLPLPRHHQLGNYLALNNR